MLHHVLRLDGYINKYIFFFATILPLLVRIFERSQVVALTSRNLGRSRSWTRPLSHMEIVQKRQTEWVDECECIWSSISEFHSVSFLLPKRTQRLTEMRKCSQAEQLIDSDTNWCADYYYVYHVHCYIGNGKKLNVCIYIYEELTENKLCTRLFLRVGPLLAFCMHLNGESKR